LLTCILRTCICPPQILVFFTWAVRGVAEVVSMWSSVDRVAQYVTSVPQEPAIAPNAEQLELQFHHPPTDQPPPHQDDGNPPPSGGSSGGKKWWWPFGKRAHQVQPDSHALSVVVDQQENTQPSGPQVDEEAWRKALGNWPERGDIRFDQVRGCASHCSQGRHASA
jgi:hypothetical protein